MPGLLIAGILVLVNTVSNFELTFLISGAGSQALVVALFYNVFAGGVSAAGSNGMRSMP
jgi:putative spermidine/putrescine transport system permease protein